MEERKIGFVLKRVGDEDALVTILTMLDGKRNLTFKKKSLGIKICSGMLISFLKTEHNQSWICYDVEILLLPAQNSFHSICFIHHVLEICYYFAPLHKPCTDVFAFLYGLFNFMFKLLDYDVSMPMEKIFVLKLLSLFGFYSYEEIYVYLGLYDKLTISFVDFNPTQKLQFLHDQLGCINCNELDALIIKGLKEHPSFYLFKTPAFLYEI